MALGAYNSRDVQPKSALRPFYVPPITLFLGQSCQKYPCAPDTYLIAISYVLYDTIISYVLYDTIPNASSPDEGNWRKGILGRNLKAPHLRTFFFSRLLISEQLLGLRKVHALFGREFSSEMSNREKLAPSERQSPNMKNRLRF